MNLLIAVAILSLLGASFMLYRKIVAIQPHLKIEENHGHTNFIVEFLRQAKKGVLQYFDEIYTELRQLMHDLMSYLAAKMYKLSSASAQEFLRFYNFVQGRKELKKAGNASAFILDMEEHKVSSRVARKRTT